jgi:DNA repair photolyase
VFVDHLKQIVNKVESTDLPFLYSLNPYQGCEHGCAYCYARNAHTFGGMSAGLDFERKIVVPNAPKLLEEFINKKNYQPATMSLSGNTDCYQPLERQYKITRGLLEVFLKYRHPVGIITKNALILRDIDLLAELASMQLVHVFVSSRRLMKNCVMMEPRTSSSENR